ncbi:hypothetical protein DI53_0065 [Sphingobacterium deserti]|uniref:Uncharacterized protein n=1 Tax=Sphingobacterium deserti TaxID=1229276 RepID=A0A0B8TC85_9SPHI|nr:hypothetical protein DI53_0065 [Sphingobacterium deserti]
MVNSLCKKNILTACLIQINLTLKTTDFLKVYKSFWNAITVYNFP